MREAVADTLQELWISYNLIEKIKGLSALRNLKVLYISNNLIKDWSEFNRLQELESLEDLVVVGNPIADGLDEATWRAECIKRLPTIKKLDGEPVVLNEEPQL
ncbi:dynein axonemal light chain 1 [Lucilia cuprina]|uniref:dynein axonemal light chain 1 n=1 Tax=Lucilia cuprina TaxID=7375 RepID=UPI001F066A39|nr:dynein axonemal light chain 1 [Lucilia cuprina]